MAHTVTRLDGRCPGRLKEAGEGLEVVTLLQVQRAVLGHVMRLDHLTIRQPCSLFNHGDAKDARGHLQNQVFSREEFSTMEIVGKATQTQRKKQKGYTPKMLIEIIVFVWWANRWSSFSFLNPSVYSTFL